MERLRQRADFLAAATGAKASGSAFVLQARSRGDAGAPRIGITVSRKVGTAVERNRVRRRLRALVRGAPGARIAPGHDYVLIGRRAALHVTFGKLVAELEGALRRVHGGQRTRAGESIS